MNKTVRKQENGVVMIENKIDDGLSYIRRFERRLGIADGFFESLYREDDWSFIIKLHALIEAAAADMIVTSLGRPKLKKALSRIPLSDATYGKASMLGSLDVLSSSYVTFIRKLSELRNDAVHNVENTNLNLKSKLEKLDKQQRKSWAKALAVSVKGNDQDKIKILLEEPKGIIWISALCLMTQIAINTRLVESEAEVSSLEKELFRALEEMRS
ncbi:hypothetical protein [Vreelandella zhaodongensis]|uniref:hypothetical protein n=1 Tax=Vreelandella zhaodongensis TaxID=1176240 RepID=UPI003EBAB7A0